MKTVYPPQTKFAGGINREYKNLFGVCGRRRGTNTVNVPFFIPQRMLKVPFLIIQCALKVPIFIVTVPFFVPGVNTNLIFTFSKQSSNESLDFCNHS